MGNRGTEEHKMYLFDLAHGNLSPGQTVRGFLKFYALEGLCVENVQNDLVFRTRYGAYHAEETMERLRTALGQAVDGTIRLGEGSSGTEGKPGGMLSAEGSRRYGNV